MYNLEVDIQGMKRLQDRLAPAPEEVSEEPFVSLQQKCLSEPQLQIIFMIS